MIERGSGRVASPPGPCRSGDAATASSSLRDGDPSRGPTEAERMQAAFDRITHRQIMANARRLSAVKHRRTPNWAFAMDLFGLGSTYAWAICERMGIDPDATTLTPFPSATTETHSGSVHDTPPLAEGDAHPLPDPFAGITTDPALLEALKRAAKREMTPAEHHAQRRSWIIGEMGIEHPELSREQIEALADRAVGPAPAARTGSEVKED